MFYYLKLSSYHLLSLLVRKRVVFCLPVTILKLDRVAEWQMYKKIMVKHGLVDNEDFIFLEGMSVFASKFKDPVYSVYLSEEIENENDKSDHTKDKNHAGDGMTLTSPLLIGEPVNFL